MFVIYKAEFPNGKVYIGKSKDFDSRKIKHSYSTRYYNTKLTNAINKCDEGSSSDKEWVDFKKMLDKTIGDRTCNRNITIKIESPNGFTK